MKPLRFCLFVLFISTIVLAQSNPVPFINQPLVPDAATPGGAGFTLTVNGTGFVQGSTVNWNGSPRSTTFVSEAQIMAAILPSDIATANTASIMVVNPSPGGGASNSAFFGTTPSTAAIAMSESITYAAQYPYAITTGDFNGDGKLDLATANESGFSASGSVTVLLGKGDGTFQAPVNYPGVSDATSIVAADFNGDGKLDLAVGTTAASIYDSNVVCIMLGNGDGTFQPCLNSVISGPQALCLATGDFNGDGKLDLAATNTSNNTVSILVGNGDGTFQPYVNYTTGAWVTCVATGDFNGDGKLDLATVNNTSPYVVSVLLGNGDGTFQPHVDYQGAASYSITLADFNGDGKLDLGVVGAANDTVSIYLGNGDGTFQLPINTSFASITQKLFAAAGDFNGDGKLDLAVSGSGPPIFVLLGAGDGTFSSVLSVGSTGYYYQGIGVGDFNADGRLDLAVADSELDISILLQQLSPIVTLSSTGLIFGNQNVGTTSPSQNVTLTNSGSAALNITSIATSGNFSQTNSCPVTGSLAAGSNCVISVTFTPSAEGTQSGALTITDNATGSPQLVQLSGVGLQSLVKLAPTSLNFGNQTVGIASTSQSVTLTNTGNATLTITSIAVNLSSGSYAQTSTCGTSLLAGTSCTVSLSWTPSVAGNMTGSITFTDNAPGNPQTVSLTGLGVTPTVMLSPTSLTFPTQVVFTTSAAQTVTLTNTGLGILSITKVSVTGAFTQTTTCGTQVVAGASCTFSVKFAPTKSGTLAGSISITDNATGSPQKITLTGTGTDVQLTPTSLNFGNQPVGTKSAAKKITLSNKVSVSVSITSISITGTDKKDFGETNTCGKTVKAGASCTITVTFTPSARGMRTANVSVNDNGGGSPQTVTLSGTGTGT